MKKIIQSAFLALVVLTVLLNGCTSTSTPIPTESVPSSTLEPTATTAVVVSPTPIGPYNIVTDPEQKNQMSVLTLDDLKDGKLAEWELAQANKLGLIAKDPSKINFILENVPSVGVSYLFPSNLDKTASTRATQFFSLYKIKLDLWGFPGIVGYVASYIWEDKNGDKAMLHFLLGETGLAYLNEFGWFDDPHGFYISPADSMDDLRRDSLYAPSEISFVDDIRPIVDFIYDTQSLSKNEVQQLFERISANGIWGNDKNKIESTLFNAYINYYAPLETLRIPAFLSEAVSTPQTLPPDRMNYQFDSSVSLEDQATVKKGIELARYYLINTYGSDVKGSYLIKVVDNPSAQSNSELGRVNGEDTAQVMTINIAHHWWKEYDLPWRLRLFVHEYTHLWQSEQGSGWPGCIDLSGGNASGGHLDRRTRILTEGLAQYNGIMATTGNQGEFSMTRADAAHRLKTFDQEISTDYDVMAYAIHYLMVKKSPEAYVSFCNEIAGGKLFDTAFELGFGMTYSEFIKQVKQSLEATRLGCQDIATCNYEDLVKYGSLLPMVDFTLQEPNLIIKITDERGRPVPDINLILYRHMYNNLSLGTNGEDNATDRNGVLSAAVYPGTYSMHFCAPGHPAYGKGYSNHPTNCVYELNPFEVLPGQTTTIDFQYRDIQDHTLSSPNFLLTLLGVDGKALTDQYVQVCGYDTVSTICLNGETDADGIFRASLKAGTYILRLVQPGRPIGDSRGYANPTVYGENLDNMSAEYVIRDIMIKLDEIKSITYQLPEPNLKIEFLDINGSPTPFIGFYLCKSVDTALGTSPQDDIEKQLTGEILSHLVGSEWNSAPIRPGSLDGTCFLVDSTDKHGDFQINVDPGRYFLYFGNPVSTNTVDWTFDNVLSDIIVTNDGQVTTASYQFK